MDGKYTFVSYAHKDKKYVMKEIERMEKLGQVFWYDKSIEAGSDWADSIGVNLANASSVLYFSSKNSLKSDNCQREIAFAKEHNIPIETIEVKGNAAKIIASLAAAVIVASAVVFSLFSKSVPNVIGYETANGKQEIENSGFECNVSYGYSDNLPLGMIMAQSKTGLSLSFIPVTVTQSLGKESNLIMMPDTVDSYISDGIRMLADSGIKKFTISSGSLGEREFGFIAAQSAPAGYMISADNSINLTVAKDENPLKFEYNGYIFTIDDAQFDIDVEELPEYGLTAAEWQLFEENSTHSIFNPDDFEDVWLPAQNEAVITQNPDTCYGWVIVRDMTISADKLFNGYNELYVCPGITLTVSGSTKGKEQNTDYYVAKGGTLIFENEVDGGLYLVNDGSTIFKKSVSGGTGGALIANRGYVEAAEPINEGVTVWSFYQSSITGNDNTGGTFHDYSPYEILDASNWYEGCSGENGFGMISGKLEVYSAYKHDYTDKGSDYCIAPVLRPEDFEDSYEREFYTSSYLFLIDYTVSTSRHGRGGYYEFIAAPGVTLTIEDANQSAQLVAEKDSTIIVNSDLKGYYPYCPWFVIDGTLILNGDYIWKYGTNPIYVANRGSFIINGSFGGERAYLYNFKGSSCSGNIVDGSYVADIDWVPDYQTYSNESYSAINYDERVLRQKGYRWKYDEQKKYDIYKDTVYNPNE